MRKIFVLGLASLLLWSCNSGNTTTETTKTNTPEEQTRAGQSAVKDDESAKDVVKVAAGSPDHTTLVAAVKQAELVDALSNAGPFTVFAPTNAAFEKLPKGTVEDLMKPENKAKLQDILQYHVYVGSLKTDLMQDGQTLNEVNGGNITISKSADGKITINNKAHIVASIPASNGIIHVVDEVLLPPAK
ncbi:fasciclin domain-containing protein [Flavisolibacter ginsenosidimutans]|uniref:Fasciclin domain-containing protein n=1 Tax=Flavisolibacter ginsenosidimutans TaxID=661481 RepID=A0A5B8UHA0_9BACT|nr:fasciclin domain-containing protein [Flavisolibacter ginsenosidimutans]QEC55440.1 fasciclin domain-containing protein [Flavisolibacter ginsenosidimutans]